MNSNTLFRLVYGPSVLSPKPLYPDIPMLGMPHDSGGPVDTPGMASSDTTSRSNASSRPNVLKKELNPKRNSFSSVGDSVRVLPTITWCTVFSSFEPFNLSAGDTSSSWP